MSWSDGKPTGMRLWLAALLLALPLALGACTGLTPVYGDRGTAAAVTQPLAFATPTSRVEQVVYQELGLRFAKAAPGQDAPLLTVAVSVGTASRGRSAAPFTSYVATATAQITLTRDGEVLFEGTRKAEAPYSSRGQAFADRQAEAAAGEQAARAVAESVRLAVIAALAANP